VASYDYIIPSGVIVPDTQDLLTEVQDEYKAAFGADLMVTPNTPQGILITAEVLARARVLQNNAELANQFNPNLAGGVFLDAIAALTGSARIPAVYSTVSADLAGVPGTVIAAGKQAKETVHGELFELVDAVTLNGGGTGTGTFRAVNPGAITALADTLTQIVDGVIGWETVTNPDAATVGSATQSDAGFRNLRRVTLASQGTSLAEAIISELYNTDGVKSLAFRENVASTTEVIDGVTMAPHSIYACVDGGTDADVAAALVAKKSAGAAYNGDTTVSVTIPFSGQVMDVKFDRPDEVVVLVRVTIAYNAAVADIEGAVTQAILDYANGDLSDEGGLTVGTPVSPFELSGAINREYPTLFVKNVELSLDFPVSYSNNPIPIEIFEKALITSSTIEVVIS
jgi:hypothetical protein